MCDSLSLDLIGHLTRFSAQLITYNLVHKSCRQLSSVYWDSNVSLTCVRDVFPVVASLRRRIEIIGNASVT